MSQRDSCLALTLTSSSPTARALAYDDVFTTEIYHAFDKPRHSTSLAAHASARELTIEPVLHSVDRVHSLACARLHSRLGPQLKVSQLLVLLQPLLPCPLQLLPIGDLSVPGGGGARGETYRVRLVLNLADLGPLLSRRAFYRLGLGCSLRILAAVCGFALAEPADKERQLPNHLNQ